MSTHTRLWLAAVAVLALGTLGAPQARAGFESDFQAAGALNYAVLYEGAGNKQLNFNNGTINGNIGLGDLPNGTGTPQFTISNASLTGNIDFAGTANTSGISGPPPNNVSGGGTFTGTINSGVSQVDTALNQVNSESASLGMESGTSLTVSLQNNDSQTVSATSGKLDANGNYVFTVSSFTFNNGATLTIDGTGLLPGQDVVFNFSDNVSFGGQIVLTGGLTSDLVLFNVTGGMDLTAGNTLQSPANGATLVGTYLDPNGAISITHATVNGRVFGGDTSNLQIVSGGNINAPSPPSAPEPSPLCLLGIGGLCLLGFMAVPRLRRKATAA